MDGGYERIDIHVGDILKRQFWRPDVGDYEPVTGPLLFTGILFTAEFGHAGFTYSNAPYLISYICCVGAYTFTKEDVWGDVSSPN